MSDAVLEENGSNDDTWSTDDDDTDGLGALGSPEIDIRPEQPEWDCQAVSFHLDHSYLPSASV